MGNIHIQRQYLASLIKVGGVERTRSNSISRRQSTYKYYFIKENSDVQVCRKFFRNTFNVSETFLRNVIKKKGHLNIISKDESGRQKLPTKRPEKLKEIVKAHINSLPQVPSHYCR